MDRWEYISEIISANGDSEEAQRYMESRSPGVRLARYSPEWMQYHLDRRGADGWELVHMQPVAGVGGNMDIHFQGQVYSYSHHFFCVFKRKIG